MLSTILIAYLALVGCAICVWAAWRNAERAADSAIDLRNSRGRIVALEAEAAQLLRRLQKLSGQFHAFKSSFEDGSIFEPTRLEHAEWTPIATYCENYGIAQKEGPRSKAAACECAYCVEMRKRRAQGRRDLIPGTAAGQAELARENAREG